MRFRRPAGMLPLPVPELITERHSTVLSTRGWHDGTMNYPQRRFWRRGRLTMSATASANISDLHFMRWQSTRWINNPPVPGEEHGSDATLCTSTGVAPLMAFASALRVSHGSVRSTSRRFKANTPVGADQSDHLRIHEHGFDQLGA